MALTERQDILYQSTASIYRAGTRATNPTTGEVTDDNFALVAVDQRCYFDYTQNDDDPIPAVGRVKRRSALTEDNIHFEASQDIQSQDYVRNTTAGSPTFGEVHRIEGPPKITPSQGDREANMAICQAMTEEKPPAHLVALFP